VLLVTLIEAAQSLQGAERLLQFEALEALNAENFNLTDSECVFNFTDLLSDEVTCIGNITAPTVGVTVSSVLTGGNCTDLNIAPPGILTSAITRDNDKVISTVQFALIPVPEVQGEISLTEFCLTTNILYQGIDMLNQKKPITVEFQYDGSFEITAGVAQNDAIGEKWKIKQFSQPMLSYAIPILHLVPSFFRLVVFCMCASDLQKIKLLLKLS